ncbi:MAG: 50S ribosomal protein L18 [Candidatus Harrisonbacteria bacterium]|nr:50S ribosomal protein L18 [Candidatus Harrisonbacteria bacterium]
MKKILINKRKQARAKRIRAKIFGVAAKPRLSVFRSNKYTYAQLIDDSKGITLISGNTKTEKGKKSERALTLGKNLAEKAKKSGIEAVIFDKGSYKYHGRIKSIADGAREGGLKF